MDNRFYNTTNLSGKQLQQAQETCNNIRDFVTHIFSFEEHLSPFQAHSLACQAGFQCTINGIRATITNLTNTSYLEKTDELIMGPHGRSEHIWKLRKEAQLELL